MSAFQQQRQFRFGSSSTWVLLLLSLYFSWICPAEANVIALPCLGLVTTQPVADAEVCSLPNFSKAAEPLALSVFTLAYPAVSSRQSLAQQKQREALLPASNVVVQLKSHRPRGAFALC